MDREPDDTDGIAKWWEGDYFPRIFVDYRSSGGVTTGPIGNCTAEVFDAKAFVAFAVVWMNPNLGG